MKHRRFVLGAGLMLGTALAGLAGWHWLAEPAAGAARPAPPTPAAVALATAERRDVPVWRSGLGTVQAFQTVTVRARVDGQLDRIAFTEGQQVQAGDLLAQIDPRPFQATLDQAMATKARDEAQLANARLDLQRYQALSRSEGTSRQQLDTQRATVGQLEATVQGDAASIDSARTQLAYTRITAPIGGRLGVRLVDQGNIVHATDTTGIVVIAQLHPIALLFTLPQDDLSEVLRGQQEAQAAISTGTANTEPNEPPPNGLQVQALARDGSVLSRGRLLLADNQIDPGSGTVRLKASFPNQDDALWPGQLVAARLLLETRRGATTLPLTAVQRGQQGSFVYVLASDQTVEVRPLRLGPSADGAVVAEAGLAPGEQVVTAGFERLHPGQRVRPQQAQAAAEAGPSPGAAAR